MVGGPLSYRHTSRATHCDHRERGRVSCEMGGYTLEDIASHWRQGFVPPWLDDIKQDSTLYTQEWRKRVEDRFDR